MATAKVLTLIDPRFRTPSSPSVLLTEAQTEKVYKFLIEGTGLKSVFMTTEQQFAEVRSQLIEMGWIRIEKHGDSLLLTAAVCIGDDAKLNADYVKYAKQTGCWSFMDYVSHMKKNTLLKRIK